MFPFNAKDYLTFSKTGSFHQYDHLKARFIGSFEKVGSVLHVVLYVCKEIQRALDLLCLSSCYMLWFAKMIVCTMVINIWVASRNMDSSLQLLFLCQILHR